MTVTKEFELELQDGTEVNVELPAKVPAVLGMNTRSKINVGFEGQGKSGTVKVENVQEVVNNAQKYLIENILENHTSYDWDQITLETHDRLWGFYAPQINGKKKASSSHGSETISGKEVSESQE